MCSMEGKMKKYWMALATILFWHSLAHAVVGNLQNVDFATPAYIVGAGGSLNQLLHETNIWSTVFR